MKASNSRGAMQVALCLLLGVRPLPSTAVDKTESENRHRIRIE
jgi:hypothetical protein